MEKQIEELKEWVKNNYNHRATGYTPERSNGNYCDVFNDGVECGTSLAAYEIGSILEMTLKKPIEVDDEVFF